MSRFFKSTTLVLVFAILAAGLLYFLKEPITSYLFFSPTSTSTETGLDLNNGENTEEIEVMAEGLDIPWEIAFLPNGDLLVTERPGVLRRIGQDGGVFRIEGVRHVGEGGLLGMALHPEFEQNRWLYLYLTIEANQGTVNRVERYRLENNRLTNRQVILQGIPGAVYHDGGRIAFGPDGFLYITTGDATEPDLAQDVNSLAGKILRIRDDGSIPADNPFGNEAYSLGHRNPQGLAWDNQGRLWVTEHGRSGIRSGFDELNLIEKGANYGWPVIQGDEERVGMRTPVIHSGPSETWAPAGAAFADGSIFFAGLRGQSLYEVEISNSGVSNLKAHFRDEFGRLRAVVLGSDNSFYISTSNTDGRGNVQEGDDKIIRISKSLFE